MPCFQAAPGTQLNASVYKTVAIVGVQNGNVWSGVSAFAFIGVDASFGTTGFRQVASYDAQSFYLSGNSAQASGFLYIANLSMTVAVPIVGQLPGQPGYTDARGVGLYLGKLYGTSGDTDFTNIFSIGSGPAPVASTL